MLVLSSLLSEIAEVLGDRKEVTGDDLDKLKYTEQVLVSHHHGNINWPAPTISGDPRGTKYVPSCRHAEQRFAQRRSDSVWLLYSRGYSHECEPHLRMLGLLFHYCIQITSCVSLMCRNPEYFNDPDTFEPSRFDADKTRYIEVHNMVTCTMLGPSHRPGPFVYFPFSVGHRSCIGRHFAMVSWKDCFKEATGLQHTWVMWCEQIILTDWNQTYPCTTSANLQGDTASFIRAGHGTGYYPTTKGPCSLHSSGNWRTNACLT